jgi:hypothetical protein
MALAMRRRERALPVPSLGDGSFPGVAAVRRSKGNPWLAGRRDDTMRAVSTHSQSRLSAHPSLTGKGRC